MAVSLLPARNRDALCGVVFPQMLHFLVSYLVRSFETFPQISWLIGVHFFAELKLLTYCLFCLNKTLIIMRKSST